MRDAYLITPLKHTLFSSNYSEYLVFPQPIY